MDALQIGTPVVTWPGPFMRGRQSKAFLEVAGAPDLVAMDEAHYVRLATEPARIAEALSGFDSLPLSDDMRSVRALERHITDVLSS